MARLLLVDDDDTTREVLGLLLRTDGWDVAEASNGDDAIALAPSFTPDVVLSDLQMPGLCGTGLAMALRSACKGTPAMLAMTATLLPGTPAGYDALLQKPFTAVAVREAASGIRRPASADQHTRPALAMPVFERLKYSIPATQLRALYELALSDAERRIRLMEKATDPAAIRAEAHALKGSCGMIGADRLGALAASVESNGLPESSLKVQRIADFREEISALRRMLEKLLTGDVQRHQSPGV